MNGNILTVAANMLGDGDSILVSYDVTDRFGRTVQTSTTINVFSSDTEIEITPDSESLTEGKQIGDAGSRSCVRKF